MERDTLKEKIKYYTELLKIFWTIEVVLIGGLSTLFINLDNPFKISLFVLGLFLEILVVLFIRDFQKQIQCLLRNLEVAK